jgi:hypothetical protein
LVVCPDASYRALLGARLLSLQAGASHHHHHAAGREEGTR